MVIHVHFLIDNRFKNNLQQQNLKWKMEILLEVNKRLNKQSSVSQMTMID